MENENEDSGDDTKDEMQFPPAKKLTEKMKDQSFIHYYLGQQDTHADPSNVSNLVKNFVRPVGGAIRNNPYLYRSKMDEDAFDIDMSIRDMQ